MPATTTTTATRRGEVKGWGCPDSRRGACLRRGRPPSWGCHGNHVRRTEGFAAPLLRPLVRVVWGQCWTGGRACQVATSCDLQPLTSLSVTAKAPQRSLSPATTPPRPTAAKKGAWFSPHGANQQEGEGPVRGHASPGGAGWKVGGIQAKLWPSCHLTKKNTVSPHSNLQLSNYIFVLTHFNL